MLLTKHPPHASIHPPLTLCCNQTETRCDKTPRCGARSGAHLNLLTGTPARPNGSTGLMENATDKIPVFIIVTLFSAFAARQRVSSSSTSSTPSASPRQPALRALVLKLAIKRRRRRSYFADDNSHTRTRAHAKRKFAADIVGISHPGRTLKL